MNFHHLFAVLLFGHNLTSDIFFIQQRHCVKRLEQCLTFDPFITLIWNLNGIWIGISDILIKQKTFLCRILTIISYLLRRSCKHHGNRTTNRTNIAAEINKMHVVFSKHPRRFSCVWKIRLRLSYEITRFTKRTRRKCKYMYVKM